MEKTTIYIHREKKMELSRLRLITDSRMKKALEDEDLKDIDLEELACRLMELLHKRYPQALADRYGARIIGSELVGLTPAKALIDCAEYYLKLENFDGRKQAMEYHLIGLE